MLNERSTGKRALMLLIPTLILVVVLGVGGARQTDPGLFNPLSSLYQTIKNYFYAPERINDQDALHGAMRGLVEQLNDPHSEFLDPAAMEKFEESLRGEFSGVGIVITVKDNVLTVIAPLSGTPAYKAGVRAGDRIIAIDGESTEGITIIGAAVRIRGEVGTEVTLTVRREDDSEEDITIVRATIIVPSAESELIADGRIAYIRLVRFDANLVRELDQALRGFDLDTLDGIVLDLRNNPGGRLSAAISASSRFVDEGLVIVSIRTRIARDQSHRSAGNVIPNLPIAVLINGGTASGSEIMAAAIRDHEMGILIGEQSFGKGLIQQVFSFRDGSALKLSTGEYTTPLGLAVHGVGISPDIVTGEDEDPLDIAIAWIEEHAGVLMPISLGAAEGE